MSLCTLVFCTMLTMVQICCISQFAIGDAYWETENLSIMINSTQSIWKYLLCARSIMQSKCASWMHFMTPRVRESHTFMQWIPAWNHGDPCALETLFVHLTLQNTNWPFERIFNSWVTHPGYEHHVFNYYAVALSGLVDAVLYICILPKHLECLSHVDRLAVLHWVYD